MAFRKKMSRSNSKRSFTKGAMNVHPRNSLAAPTKRGGIRL